MIGKGILQFFRPGPPVLSGGNVTAVLSAGYLYVRTAWNATNDLVERVSYNLGGPSTATNDTVAPNGMRLIPVATSAANTVSTYNAVAAYPGQLAGQTDDSPPVNYNNTYNGGGHSPSMGKLVPATAHGKATADEGSTYTSNGVTWTLMKVIDANNLWMMSANTGTATIWAYNTAALPDGTMTHASGGVNVGNFTFAGTTTIEMRPSAQNLSKTVLMNGAVPLTVDGVYTCQFIEISESYSLPNMESVAVAIRAAVGTGGVSFIDPSLQQQITCSYLWHWEDNGSLTVRATVAAVQDVSLAVNSGYIGFVQSQPIIWSAANSETVNLYIPRVNAIVGSIKTWNFSSVEDILTNGFEQIDLVASTWSAPTNPPERMVQIVKTSGGVNRFGYVHGYSRQSGVGANLANYATNQSGRITSVRKMYMFGLSKLSTFLSGGSTFATGQSLSAVAYRIPYDLTTLTQATCWAVRQDGATAECIVDFHQNVAGLSLPINPKYNGKTVTVLDSQGSITLGGTVVAGAISCTVTGGFGSAVLSVA